MMRRRTMNEAELSRRILHRSRYNLTCQLVLDLIMMYPRPWLIHLLMNLKGSCLCYSIVDRGLGRGDHGVSLLFDHILHQILLLLFCCFTLCKQ